MGPPLREALRRLCHEFGWSYAVFWRATGFGSGMHLIWEDGYYDRKPGVSRLKVQNDFFSELECQADDRIGVLVDKIMASQVHVVGDGLIGRAASLGKHQWIEQDTLDRYGSTSKDFTEIDCQIGAGMQTIVVVPVLPFGVIQLGSAQMVRENIAFINHVKSLILKQNCGSGALPSDTTQKALREKSQIYSSPGLLFGRQSADACTKIDNKLLVTTNGCSPELVKSPAPRSFTQSFSAVSSHLNKKMQPSASEVMPIKQIIKSTYPLGKLILQGTQDIFPKPDMEILSANIGFECQNDPSVLSSDLLSNSLKVLEEELMFTSAIGALESTNNVSASLEDTKSIPLNVKRESSNMQDELRNASSISGGIAEFSTLSAKLSASGAPPILHQRSHSLGNPGISEVCNKDQPFSINKVSHTESSVGVLKGNDDLIQASCVFSSASDVLVSCSDMLPGILQECELCYTNPVQRDQRCKNVDYEANGACPAEHRQCVQGLNEYKLLHKLKNDTSPLPLELTSSNDLFCMLGFDQKTYCSNGSLNDVLVPRNSTSACSLRTGIPKLPTDSDACPVFDSLKDQVSCSGLFYVDDSNQLLDAVISNINSGGKQGSDDSVSCKTSITNVHSSHYAGTPNHDELLLSKHSKDDFIGFPPVLAQTEPACSSYGKSSSSFEKEYTQKTGLHKSQISSWVENCQSVKYDCVSDSSSKKVAEVGKLNRKRPRPGESPRPRPKDRQMIQDRIKELREIVPNGAKCSIDALLEKTIKHMLFLQNVTKHADKLKIAGEPKISNEEGGLLLKDNFEGGATWAFEVGTQPMICPIIVEDLNPPRQMLVEMLCEEQGFFLEIADFIRRLGLTILKGVMEARKNKVWARFAVEANRDVTRMEIFLSLVQLLEPTAGSSMALPSVGNIKLPYTMFHQTSVPARVI